MPIVSVNAANRITLTPSPETGLTPLEARALASQLLARAELAERRARLAARMESGSE